VAYDLQLTPRGRWYLVRIPAIVIAAIALTYLLS